MNLELTLDRRSFDRALRTFSKQYGVSMREVMVDQFRLIVNQLVRMTPPKNLKQGRQSIERDLNKAFVPLDEAKALEFMEKNFKDRVPGHVFDSEGDMASFHAARRGGRGKVRKSGVIARFGDLKIYDKRYVRSRDFRRYLREVNRRVGILKSGWMAAVNKFGGKAPNFVSRHGAGHGTAADRMDRNGNGYLEAVNKVPYIGRHRTLLSSAVKGRERAVTQHFDRELKRLAKQFNKSK